MVLYTYINSDTYNYMLQTAIKEKKKSFIPKHIDLFDKYFFLVLHY